MCRTKPRRFRALAALIVFLVVAPAPAALAAAETTVAPATGGETSDPHKLEVETEKLEVEVEKLAGEVKNASGVRGFFSRYAGLAAAIGALIGAGIAFIGQSRERNRLRKADIATQKRAVAQQKAESDRDHAARFSQLLLDLGSDSEPVQAGAAVSLLSFLGHDDPTFHHQVRLATIANLKVSHPQAVTKLLRRTFEKAMSSGVPYDPIELDLSDADLTGATLRGLTLDGANLDAAGLEYADLCDTSLRDAAGRKTKLNGAVLQGEGASLYNARLFEAECFKTGFQGAELVNAHLERADMRGARFSGARMQAAHLERSDMEGARFEGANVADTYFMGCKLDDNALRSMLKAKNWEKAHFDPAHATRLQELADEADGQEEGTEN